MASQLEILINAPFDSNGIRQGAQELAKLGKAADDAGKKMQAAGQKASSFEQAANKIDRAGRNARIGLSSMGQAAALVGTNLTSILGPASGAADAIGDIVGTIGALGPAAAILGGVAIAAGLLKNKLDEVRDALIKSISANSIYILNLYQLGQAYPAVAAGAKEYAAALADVQIAEAQVAATRNQNIIVTMLFEQRLKDAQRAAEQEKAALDALVFGIKSGYDEIERLRSSMTALVSASESLEGRLFRLTAAHNAAAVAAAKQAAEAARLMGILAGNVNAAASMAEAERTQDSWFGRLNPKIKLAGDQMRYLTGEIDADGKSLKKWAEEGAREAEQAAAALASKLRSLVEGALNPTAVADRVNMTGDAWDEFRLRLEAVATGTDPSQYGEEFVKNFNALGMSAEQAAKAFKDFTLFADPKNIKLVNMQPIIESVKQQLDSMIGKANLTSAAMKEVWKNLSPTQKAALAGQGIDNVSDAVEALIDPTAQAKKQVQDLSSAIDSIKPSVTTTFNVVTKAAEAAIEAFREVLDKFIADYGNITISINAEANATPPTTPAPFVPSPGPQIPQFQYGGAFMVGGSGGIDSQYVSFRATPGERVTIAPPNQKGWTRGLASTFVFNVRVDSDARLDALARKVRAMAAHGYA